MLFRVVVTMGKIPQVLFEILLVHGGVTVHGDGRGRGAK